MGPNGRFGSPWPPLGLPLASLCLRFTSFASPFAPSTSFCSVGSPFASHFAPLTSHHFKVGGTNKKLRTMVPPYRPNKKKGTRANILKMVPPIVLPPVGGTNTKVLLSCSHHTEATCGLCRRHMIYIYTYKKYLNSF